MALVVAAPAQAALPAAPALPVRQTVDTASSASSTAAPAVGAVQQLVAFASPGKAQTLGAPAQTFQAASARPPAAEARGRPVSPPPRTAPTPVAGGATAAFSSGGIFVPFLGLLVLAALAAPRLMRRLDELPAFVRPAPLRCALERPG